MGLAVGAGKSRRADERMVGAMADADAAGLGWPGESAAGRKGTGRAAAARDRGRPYGQDAWALSVAKRLGIESSLRPIGRPPKKRRKGL